MNLTDAVASLERYMGTSLTGQLSTVESNLKGVLASDCSGPIEAFGANAQTLAAAGQIKRIAGQINVVVHALGILLCLPHILEPSERIEYVSLGAGNTGRAFDLETDLRVAEFKFINWRGGPESIRQNQLFKDFYLMAEHASEKRKYLYVLGTEHPLKFFNGRRALKSVLSKDDRVRTLFRTQFGESLQVVRDYFNIRNGMVEIVDVSRFLGPLVTDEPEDEDLDP